MLKPGTIELTGNYTGDASQQNIDVLAVAQTVFPWKITAAIHSDQTAPYKPGGIGGSIISFLGTLLGSLIGVKAGGSSGGGESVTSSITYGGERATGGPVTPHKAYLVNERGTEILMGASGTVLSNSQSRRMLEGAGGGNHYYSIDARGTDPVLTGQRTGPRSSVPTIPLLGRR